MDPRRNRARLPLALLAAIALCCSFAATAQEEPECRPAGSAAPTPTTSTNSPLSIVGIEGLYDTLASLDSNRSECVALIDTEDAPDLRQNLAKPGGLWKVRRLVARITALSGVNCYVFHYTQLKRDSFASRPQVKAIVLKAWKIPRLGAPREELHALMRETRVPMIGFCGGFHQMYTAHGGSGGPLRDLRPGEKDPNPAYNPGIFKEWGPTTVRITGRDPILEGFGDTIVIHEMHAFQCTNLPPAFVNLAETDECPVQIIKHRDKPLYGTQAHPEAYDDNFQDGKRLLLNFFKIAKLSGNLSR